MSRENQDSGGNSSFLSVVLVTVFATIISNFVWEHLKPARTKEDKEVIVVDVRNKDVELTSRPVASADKPSPKEELDEKTQPIDFNNEQVNQPKRKVQSEIAISKPFFEKPLSIEARQLEKKVLSSEISAGSRSNEPAEEITDKNDDGIIPINKPEKAKIEWLTSFEEAKRMAEKNGRTIMILCTADWISSTNEIDCKLSESKKIRNLVEQGLIPFKIHTKTGEKRHEILEKYVVSTFPYLFFLDTSGNVLGRVRFSNNINEAVERICEISKKVF